MNGYPESIASAHPLSAGTGSSRLRLTRRGRIVFTTLAAFPLVIAALAFALNGGMANASSGESRASLATVAEQVTVEGGQSLWELAETIAPSEDTREVVAQILYANDLKSADVYPGQQLAIPSQYR